MTVDKAARKIRGVFGGYYGFKMFLGLSLWGVLLLVTVTLYRVFGFRLVGVLYVAVYWFGHWTGLVELCILAVVFALAFWLDALRRPYVLLFPHQARLRSTKRAHKFRMAVEGTALIMALWALPFVRLRFGAWEMWVFNALGVGAALLEYFAVFREAPAGRQLVPAIAAMEFDRKNFDVASLGASSEQLDEEVEACQRACSRGASHPDTLQMLLEGHDELAWKGLEKFGSELARFVGVERSRLSLHDRTTAAIVHAMEEVLGASKRDGPLRVFVPDTLFDTVEKKLISLEKDGRIALERFELMTRIKAAGGGAHAARWIVEDQRFLRADVAVVPHVGHQFGVEIDIGILASCKTRPILVVDGAQALGNVIANQQQLNGVEYYATSGHKWLLGPPALGILVRNDRALDERGIPRKRLDRPFSEFPIREDRQSVTIGLGPYFGLNAVLMRELGRLGQDEIAAHGRELASIFRREVVDIPGVSVVWPEAGSSLVAFTCGPLTPAVFRAVRPERACTLIKSPVPAIRVCFHFYHSEGDVLELVVCIRKAWRATQEEAERIAMGEEVRRLLAVGESVG